ncbi:hypothetical protein ABZX30_15125 [Streptomyces sp. NPDC004542]|uniref:hypothetical protein n=1 Tax=Streptomyces sp. NPDC004542 TaxID=3154281 RepID=UPI0033BF3D1B
MTEQPRMDVCADEGGQLVVRVRLPLPAPVRPRLMLQPRRRKGEPPRGGRIVALEPTDRYHWHGVLGTVPALEEGRWDAYLVGASEEDRTPLLPGLRELRALVAGGGDSRPAPLSVRIPYVTKDGRLAIRAWHRARHAEAGRIVVTDGSITVVARLFGTRLGDGAAVSLKSRGPDTVVQRIALRPEGERDFSFTISCRELAAGGAEPEAGAAPTVWDVYVHPSAGAPRIRVARLLDDLADRKAVFVYPAATHGEVTARPYYTVDNDLSLEVASPSVP